jgi:hypothetical protein
VRPRLGALASLVGFVLAIPFAASARDESLAAVEQHLRARGASTIVEVARTFLFEGQSTSHAQRLEQRDCVAYLALGIGEVRDVDLGLYTRAGQLIAQDVAIAPFAYARVCGERGLELYASATLYAGRGQLLLLRIANAPRELGRLPPELPLAVSAGGRLEEVRSVGAALDDLSPEAALAYEERAHALLGYVAVGAPLALELRAGHARGQLLLRGGHCYRVALNVPLSRGVAIEVEGPSGERWIGRSGSDDRAALALCAPRDGIYATRVQARPLRGLALVRAFEHPRVDVARVRELGEASTLAVAEAEYVAAGRGLSLSAIGQAWVESGAPLTWSLPPLPPGCYALAVVSEVGAAAVDLRLADENGLLLAHNEGRRGVPMVFFCARREGTLRLMLKARGPDLRVSVWLGQRAKERR